MQPVDWDGFTWEAAGIIISGGMSLLAGGAAVAAAWRLGKRQTGIQEQQRDIQQRQTDIQVEQAKIFEEQTNIQSRQLALQESAHKAMLYDKRLPAYMKIYQHLHALCVESKFPDFGPVRQAFDAAWFLFPKDVGDVLAKVQSHILDHQEAEASVRLKPTDANRTKRDAALAVLFDDMTRLDDATEPYLRLG